MKEFYGVKVSIAKVPILAHPDYKKDFVIHCYASEHTMSAVLLQEDVTGSEVPISFMSVPLKNHELRYFLAEKQALLLIKFVKHFRYYILHSHSTMFFPSSVVKSILTQ